MLGGPLLSAQGVTKVYDTGAVPVHALRGINLDVASGEMSVLLGVWKRKIDMTEYFGRAG